MREFPENGDYQRCGLSQFVEYLNKKLLTANILSYDIESPKPKFIHWICNQRFQIIYKNTKYSS
jgi:hypothetical protein